MYSTCNAFIPFLHDMNLIRVLLSNAPFSKKLLYNPLLSLDTTPILEYISKNITSKQRKMNVGFTIDQIPFIFFSNWRFHVPRLDIYIVKRACSYGMGFEFLIGRLIHIFSLA